jgi:hypothetical protein
VGEPRYDGVAETYATGPDDYSVPATRCLLEATGQVAGLRVLDVACGHGLIARRYYDEGWWRADGELSALRREVGANHRMMSTYLNATTVNGLVLDAMAEPEPDEQWAERRRGAKALPVYLVVRCIRAG